jgi:hypothetical protein
MIGRLDAPGAKLDPVTPGFENSTSPNVEPGLRWISSLGTTVTVANWSVMIGNAPCSGISAGAEAGAAAGAAVVDGGAGGLRRTIGLGAVTLICGRFRVSWAAASGPHSGNNAEEASNNARRERRDTRTVMTIPELANAQRHRPRKGGR